MTTYSIVAPQFTAAIIVSGDTVIQSAPVLHWSIGRSWEDVRTYCQQRGWSIEPQVALYEPDWLEVKGHVYELHWRDSALMRVTLHEDGEQKDLAFSDLPDEIKGLL